MPPARSVAVALAASGGSKRRSSRAATTARDLRVNSGISAPSATARSELRLEASASSPPANVSSHAALLITRALKEAAAYGRRATFGWRHLRAGVLIFEDLAAGTRRTFAVGKKLGEGGYSTIWRVHEWQPDGSERQFAVKRCIIDRSDAEAVEAIEREITIMRSLPPHPNLVELIGTCKRQRGANSSGEEVFLLLELCKNGSLADLLLRRVEEDAPLTPSECATALYDMALALCHMHSQSPPLAHRDVKPENFLLSDADGRWRLCDFGSTTPHAFVYTSGMPAHEVASEEDQIHRTSTPQYRAPEMCDVRRGEPVGIAADVWALGITLYKLLFLRDLFGVPGEERLGSLNFDPTKRLSATALVNLGARPGTAGDSELLLELLRMCLTPSATKRPPIASILQHLSSRSGRIEGGLGVCRAEILRGKHTAGLLEVRGLCARRLFPKGLARQASARGVKAYLLLTCGGARMVSEVAPKGHDAQWSTGAFHSCILCPIGHLAASASCVRLLHPADAFRVRMRVCACACAVCRVRVCRVPCALCRVQCSLCRRTAFRPWSSPAGRITATPRTTFWDASCSSFPHASRIRRSR